MKGIKSYDDYLAEERLMGKSLKAQKFIELCQLVSQKATSDLAATRDLVADHTLSYDLMKAFSDKLQKL
jgi:hypothetical protein